VLTEFSNLDIVVVKVTEPLRGLNATWKNRLACALFIGSALSRTAKRYNVSAGAKTSVST
jgi:hypothetical protein